MSAEREKKTWKRDELEGDERAMQHLWKEDPAHHDASFGPVVPAIGAGRLFTFPYPYTNGHLHLGHGFTSVFYDAMARYARLQGSHVVQSFSYHLTGMPIVAAADKLRHEYESDRDDPYPSETTVDGKMTQFGTLRMMGIPADQIANFTDPHYWTDYFPPICAKTIGRFGIASDPAKSFFTTEKNQYYDAFARWHFSKLHEESKLVFGKRMTIFSIKDNQPCLGHERSDGEDSVPQRLWLIKFRVTSPESIGYKPSDKVYMIGMTMRPETLVGLTNVWVDAAHSYNVYKLDLDFEAGTEYWIMNERNRLNLQYQQEDRRDNPYASAELCGTVCGADLVEHMVRYEESEIPVYALDFDTNPIYKNLRQISKGKRQGKPIKAPPCLDHLKIDVTKGTGIVGSVPSDSPIDYLAYMYKKCYHDLNTWGEERERITPIIQNGDSNRAAVEMVEERLISSNDMPYIASDDMAQVKEYCYVTSVAKQTMIATGKNVVTYRNEMESDDLVTYYEPDSIAISRSGEELIVALEDQWFIDYSDPEWKRRSLEHVATMKFNDDKARDGIIGAINWLEQWPCSRTYGLGSRIPIHIVRTVMPDATDADCPLIDSLSDSTIYMCLYTIYDLMKQFAPHEFTYEVFDYIFMLKHSDNKDYEKFAPLRQSFLAHYPVTLRVSAKDLVNNHLAMCIMNHVAVWNEEFMAEYNRISPNKITSFGPQEYRVNGYITVSKPGKKGLVEKMSKSKGNFKTLDQAIDAYAADPIRFTFCSSGIGMDDAYFDQDLALRTVEKMHKEKEFLETFFAKAAQLTLKTEASGKDEDDVDGDNNDQCCDGVQDNLKDLMPMFTNAMVTLLQKTRTAYDMSDTRAINQSAYHEMLNLRDDVVKIVGYRNIYQEPYLQYIITIFVSFITMMYPIIPHFCERIHRSDNYQTVLNRFVFQEPEPERESGAGAGSESKTNRFRTLNECYAFLSRLLPSERHAVLGFEWRYVKNIASGISSNLHRIRKRGRQCKHVTLSFGTALHENSESVWALLQDVPFGDQKADTNEVIAAIKKQNPGKSSKDIGPIIQEYRRIEQLYIEYGQDMFEILRSDEYDLAGTVNRTLRPFLTTVPDCPKIVVQQTKTPIKFCEYQMSFES